MPLFAAITEDGPRWEEKKGINEQRGWDEHYKFMSDSVRERFIILAGPLSNWPKVHALLIVDASNEKAARTRLSEDPFIRSGVLKINELYSWELHYGRLLRDDSE